MLKKKTSLANTKDLAMRDDKAKAMKMIAYFMLISCIAFFSGVISGYLLENM